MTKRHDVWLAEDANRIASLVVLNFAGEAYPARLDAAFGVAVIARRTLPSRTMLPWRYVIVDARRGILVPPRCARCDGPPTTGVLADHVLAPVRKAPRMLTIPHCAPCARLVLGASRRRFALSVTVIGASAALAGSLAWRTVRELSISLALALVAALCVAAAGQAVLARKAPGDGDAVVSVQRVAHWTWTLIVRRPRWAEELAALNDALCREMPAATPRVMALVAGLASVTAVAAAAGVWRLTHHELYVDNATAAPIAVWVDGRARAVIAPGASSVEPPSVWVAHGRHVIGESSASASSPRVETTFDVDTNALFSPGGETSYWRSTVVYGRADDGGAGEPVPLAPVLSLRGVEDVLAPSPHAVSTEHGKSVVRGRIDRDAVRGAFVRAGCSTASVQLLDGCRTRARSDSDLDACFEAAKKQCAVEEPR